MNRHEIKFDVTNINIKKIKNNLCLKTLYPERKVFSYYFDTLNNKFFFESEEGHTPRKKIRIRTYDFKNFVLEIKFTDFYSRKKISIKNFKFTNLNLQHELNKLKIKESIFPKILVQYSRKYFLSRLGRFTYDTNIEYYKINNLLNKTSFKNKDHKNILELKINNIKNNKEEIASKLPFKELRNSKYCNGVLSFNNF